MRLSWWFFTTTMLLFFNEDRSALGLLPSVASVRNNIISCPTPSSSSPSCSTTTTSTTTTRLYSSNNNNNIEDRLGEKTFGGYTVKQRLREEVESPFRKVRLLFLASSAGSALTALYFSALSTLKASMGGFADAPPLEEALASDAINLGAAIVCGLLAFREYRAGESNLQRIARGGQLASLVVEPAAEEAAARRVSLKEYRRNSRVLIAAGGEEYISKLALSLNADQLSDTNTIPQRLAESDIVVVPVLLGYSGSRSNDLVVRAGDTRLFWNAVEAGNDDEAEHNNRNLDITRSNSVVAFPRGSVSWSDYLDSETKTAQEQGFDVLQKGITLIVKKNGRILRRVTGQPPWRELIGTMEVMDGSRFGMPGDSERYGGP